MQTTVQQNTAPVHYPMGRCMPPFWMGGIMRILLIKSIKLQIILLKLPTKVSLLCFVSFETLHEIAQWYAGIILVLGSVNKKRRYSVKSPLIGSAYMLNDPWLGLFYMVLDDDQWKMSNLMSPAPRHNIAWTYCCRRLASSAVSVISCGYFVAITPSGCSTYSRAKYVISHVTSRKWKCCFPCTWKKYSKYFVVHGIMIYTQ